MIPEIGQFALILAFCVALVQAVFPLAGTFARNPAWLALARPAAGLQFALLALAFAWYLAIFSGLAMSGVWTA